MNTIKAILFDKDGTLFDFVGTWGAFTHDFLWELSGCDTTFADVLANAVGFVMQDKSFERGSLAIAGTPSDFHAALRPHFSSKSDEEFRALTRSIDVRIPNAEVVPLRAYLSDLRTAGYVLGVATNAGEQGAIDHLGQVDIVDQFDFIAGYDSGHGAKPAPGMLLAFAQAVNVAPSEVIMVGDSTHDLHAARAAGMGRVAVLTGVATHDDLVDHSDVVLPSIADLPNWLATQ